MKITIITVCHNSQEYIESTIESILIQKYKDVEYIIIDGGSTDATIDIISRYADQISLIISEPDKGIYDAMNKGIRSATGDIIGTLNSDDFFSDDRVLDRVAEALKDENIDAVYGDVKFVDPENHNRIIRYYSSKNFRLNRIKFGFMVAHPSFYVRKNIFEKYGYYKDDYWISADFELMIRFLYTHKIRTKYLPFPFVDMRPGGISTKSLKNKILLNNENIRACRENGIKTNLFYMYSKYFVKIFEYL